MFLQPGRYFLVRCVKEKAGELSFPWKGDLTYPHKHVHTHLLEVKIQGELSRDPCPWWASLSSCSVPVIVTSVALRSTLELLDFNRTLLHILLPFLFFFPLVFVCFFGGLVRVCRRI